MLQQMRLWPPSRRVLEGLGATIVLAIGIGVGSARPFKASIVKQNLQLHTLPYSEEDTVPMGALLAIAVLVPFAGIAAARAIAKEPTGQHAVALIASHGANLLVTASLKATVGRYRPDFGQRCYPSEDPGSLPVNPLKANLLPNCESGAEKDVLREGRKSFPSGHSSIAAAGMASLALMALRMRGPFAARAAGVLACALSAGLVGVSRLQDNRHFGGDVIAGLAIGFLSALLGQEIPAKEAAQSQGEEEHVPLRPAES